MSSIKLNEFIDQSDILHKKTGSTTVLSRPFPPVTPLHLSLPHLSRMFEPRKLNFLCVSPQFMFKRLLAFSLVAVALVVIASPTALYWLGLNGVEGLPAKPAVFASQERQVWVWDKARGCGIPSVAPLNPYSFVIRLFANSLELNAPEVLSLGG